MRFFLIDRVTEVVLGERASAIKNVTLTDEIVHDHFPDFPVLPGVLVVEALVQLSGFLLEVSQKPEGGPVLRSLLVQIQRAKFSRPVVPGDQLELRVRLGASLDTAAEAIGEAFVDGERAAKARLTFMLKVFDSERLHAQRRALYALWTRGLATPIPIV